MNKVLAFLELFRKGSAVADPALWKNRAALTLALTGLILALAQLAKGYGYDLGIDSEMAATLAAGIAVVVGLLSNYATSDKVGLPAKPAAPVDVPAGSVGDPSSPAERDGPH